MTYKLLYLDTSGNLIWGSPRARLHAIANTEFGSYDLPCQKQGLIQDNDLRGKHVWLNGAKVKSSKCLTF